MERVRFAHPPLGISLSLFSLIVILMFCHCPWPSLRREPRQAATDMVVCVSTARRRFFGGTAGGC